MTIPKENRTHFAPVLIEQFEKKGYCCEEVKESDATIIILRHDRKSGRQHENFMELGVHPYKDFLRNN